MKKEVRRKLEELAHECEQSYAIRQKIKDMPPPPRESMRNVAKRILGILREQDKR
jgi:hypothetical protein